MEYIGDRISVQKKDNELSIVILSLKDELKSKLLLAWLIVWSACGLIVLIQYSTFSDPDVKSAVIVWMGFWAYFEYLVISAYKWRKSGKEIIKIKNESLSYIRSTGSKGKSKEYKTDFIKDLHLIDLKENSFFENLNDSYWMVGNERVGFDYSGADIKIGIQLKTEDAKALKKLIERKIK